MKRLVPIIVVIATLTLILVLHVLRQPGVPSTPQAPPAKPIGKSTLSHGTPVPDRPEREPMAQAPADRAEKKPAR